MIHPVLKYREANEQEEKLLKGNLIDKYNQQRHKILDEQIEEAAVNELRKIFEEELNKIFK